MIHIPKTVNKRDWEPSSLVYLGLDDLDGGEGDLETLQYFKQQKTKAGNNRDHVIHILHQLSFPYSGPIYKKSW